MDTLAGAAVCIPGGRLRPGAGAGRDSVALPRP